MLFRKSLFIVAYVMLWLLVSVNRSQAQSETPKFEVGPQFSLLRIVDYEVPVFGGPATISDYRRIYRTNVGFGGRAGINITDWLGIESEFNYFPQEENRSTRRAVQGLFGAKAGIRGGRLGIFGKARPGFFHYNQAVVCITTPCNDIPKTKFALDLGGVFELYLSRAVVIRFDLGDTLIRGEQIRFTTMTGTTTTDIFRHNLQFSTGVGWRF